MTKNVYEFLANSAKKNPQKIAVVNAFYESINKAIGGGCKPHYTYAELDKKVKSLASKIIQTSKEISNSPLQKSVFILLPKSAECLASFYAVALSGEFYTLQDPSTPKERLKSVIAKLESKILITSRKIADEFSDLVAEFDLKTVFVDEDYEIKQTLINERLNSQIDTDLLYVLFTSGSTGEPKGVCIRHKSVIDYAINFVKELEFLSDEIVANQFPFYFDASIKEIFPSILAGATLHIIPNEIYAFIPKVVKYLNENKITTIMWVPTVLNYYSKVLNYENIPSLYKILWGGELLQTSLLHTLQKAFAKAVFINHYGPTEITCGCIYNKINRNIDENEIIPIGKPFKNTRAYLFDENLQLILPNEINKKGILYIGGTGVAAGYYKDSEKTRAAFIQNPLHNNYSDIIYNTGDVVAYNEFGELVCYGRADNQIKYKGHRIELGEIENTATSLEGVGNAVCVFDELIVLIFSGNADETQLKNHLKENLPNYMIPSKFIHTDELKLNQNGKIDRKYYKQNYKELIK